MRSSPTLKDEAGCARDDSLAKDHESSGRQMRQDQDQTLVFSKAKQVPGTNRTPDKVNDCVEHFVFRFLSVNQAQLIEAIRPKGKAADGIPMALSTLELDLHQRTHFLRRKEMASTASEGRCQVGSHLGVQLEDSCPSGSPFQGSRLEVPALFAALLRLLFQLRQKRQQISQL
jgi:hypothetical protein